MRSHARINIVRAARSARILWPTISVLAVLAAAAFFLLPGIQSGPGSERGARCTSHLKLIGMALQNYHDAHECFPPAYIADEHGTPMHSWRVLLLPYFEEEPLKQLYAEYDFNEPWNGPHNRQLMSNAPHMYRCPKDSSDEAHSSYLAVVGPEASWRGDEQLHIRETKDGSSCTIAVVECVDSNVNWLEPRDVAFEDAAWGINNRFTRPAFRSHHADGAMSLFVDGSVHFLTDSINRETLRALLTPAGGEDVEIPE